MAEAQTSSLRWLVAAILALQGCALELACTVGGETKRCDKGDAQLGADPQSDEDEHLRMHTHT